MRSFPEFGIWTCAGLYIAIGVIGVFFIGTQPNIAGSTDGYGTFHVTAGPGSQDPRP